MRWDAFVSHVHEDKADFVAELARELTRRGLRIWYDHDVLEVGDSVRMAIEKGLRASDFGIVVISPDFIRKDWTNRELGGLLALEHGQKRLLSVWHRVEHRQVLEHSPTVAGRMGVRSAVAVAGVADALCRSMRRGQVSQPSTEPEADTGPSPIFLSQGRPDGERTHLHLGRCGYADRNNVSVHRR